MSFCRTLPFNFFFLSTFSFLRFILERIKKNNVCFTLYNFYVKGAGPILFTIRKIMKTIHSFQFTYLYFMKYRVWFADRCKIKPFVYSINIPTSMTNIIKRLQIVRVCCKVYVYQTMKRKKFVSVKSTETIFFLCKIYLSNITE